MTIVKGYIILENGGNPGRSLEQDLLSLYGIDHFHMYADYKKPDLAAPKRETVLIFSSNWADFEKTNNFDSIAAKVIPRIENQTPVSLDRIVRPGSQPRPAFAIIDLSQR